MTAPNVPGGRSLTRAIGVFERQFDAYPTIAASAPGRVNLIGDHTDYCGGLVLPMAISLRCSAVGRRASNGRWRIVAGDLEDAAFEFAPGDSLEHAPSWAKYVAGVIETTRGDTGALPMEIAFSSDVPIGVGLSSSAALEVAVAMLLEGTGDREVDRLEIARLCQRAEHEFAGVPCGMMDQVSVVFGIRDHAMLIDCGELHITHIPLWDEERVALFVVDSGVRHDLAEGCYAERRETCERAARALGLSTLRQADESLLKTRGVELAATQLGAVRHVLSENARVTAAAELLKKRDPAGFGQLMLASHRSLRDDISVSCPELDEIVDAAAAVPGVLGARVTGGGFGGNAIVLAHSDAAEELTRAMRTLGRTCARVRSGNGAMSDDLPTR